MAREKVVLMAVGQTFATNELRDAYFKNIMDYLRAQDFEVSIETASETDGEMAVRLLKDADAAIFSSNAPMSRDVMERLPKLKMVQRYGIGLNTIDLPAAAELGKIISYTPGYCSEEVGMHAIVMGLAVLRNLRYYDTNLRKGVWLKGNGPLPLPPRSMTIGIVGLGASGHHVAKVFSNGFGSRVIAYDPFASEEVAKSVNAELVSFDTLLAESDMVCVLAPLTKDTYHMFDAEAFKKMKNSAIIVNVSRGPLIDNDALVDALKNGEIAKAAIDVFEKEPVPVDSPLLQFDHLIATPHSAYYGQDSIDNADFLIPRLVTRALKEKRLYKKHLANPDVLKTLSGYTLIDGPVED